MHKYKPHVFLVFAMALLLFVPGDTYCLDAGHLTTYMMQGWSASYKTGFVFRGLCGTLLTLLQKPITPGLIMTLNIIIMLLYLALVYIYSLIFLKKDDRTESLLLLVFMLVQAPVLQRWLTSAVIGRLDTLLVLLFLSVLALFKVKNEYFRYITASLLSILAMLCHEGFAILFVPVIFGAMLLTDKNFRRPLCLYLIPCVAACVLITAFGRADVPMHEFSAMLAENHVNNPGYEVVDSDITMVYYMDVADKIRMTLDYYGLEVYVKIFLTAVILSPTIYMLLCYWLGLIRRSRGRLRVILVLLLLFSISPLFALLLGIDTFRWIGWALFNNLAALAFVYITDTASREVILETTRKRKYTLFLAIMVALLFGTFTVFLTYDIIEKNMKDIMNFIFDLLY